MISDCDANIKLNEVLQLINSEGDIFYALINHETFKFTLGGDDTFDVEKITHQYINSVILNQSMTIEDLTKNQHDIEMYDLETTRRVLFKIRGCVCSDVSTILLTQLRHLEIEDRKNRGLRSSQEFIKYSALNMGVPVEDLNETLTDYCVENV